MHNINKYMYLNIIQMVNSNVKLCIIIYYIVGRIVTLTLTYPCMAVLLNLAMSEWFVPTGHLTNISPASVKGLYLPSVAKIAGS